MLSLQQHVSKNLKIRDIATILDRMAPGNADSCDHMLLFDIFNRPSSHLNIGSVPPTSYHRSIAPTETIALPESFSHRKIKWYEKIHDPAVRHCVGRYFLQPLCVRGAGCQWKGPMRQRPAVSLSGGASTTCNHQRAGNNVISTIEAMMHAQASQSRPPNGIPNQRIPTPVAASGSVVAIRLAGLGPTSRTATMNA